MKKDQDARRAVTMRDVAREAGVSVSAVSHVVNNTNARIGQDTRERVLRAIDELGYRPNAMAKNLVKGSSRFIGLVADAIASTPFAGQIIHGAQEEAWKHGHVLLVANTEGNAAAEASAISMMLEHKVRGILYSTWYHREVKVPAELTASDTVLVNCFSPSADVRAVVPDETSGGYDATRMLLEQGHRRVAFLNTLTPSPARVGRLHGYRKALTEASLEFDRRLVFDVQPDQEGGFAAVRDILRSEATAVFCHNDRVAMGVYDGLRDRGLRVPEDLSVAGFDNQEVIAAHLRPPLSTVALPHEELGRRGVRVLLGLEIAEAGLTTVNCPSVHRRSIAVAKPR
ncbi:LacI family DNA-binding transcriptional regulator [Streptomyces sp. NPDC003753]|uniref:LacI family DNA-binding transcriptional regulator n=1 Tax=Streptomyces sp. Y2F8-2 TaxID=2759675 RepID=UPI00190861BD|nr:LacI family DNA-binding transcriptional regulator [Streptomyces sp. Y2F8-2]GHK05962.1 alanine racemase [Streptomyces sp. Y2F8-2]